MSDTEVVSLQVRRDDVASSKDETRTPTTRGIESTRSNSARLTRTMGANALAPAIEIDRLYDAPAGESSNIVRVLEQLKQMSDYLTEARRSENPIDADQLVQRVQVALPRLFALRSIGDGFALLINSLHVAFTNLHGTPLNRQQVDVVWRVLRELRTKPAISLEQGIRQVEELEECGLEVDPPELGLLLEPPESPENA